MPQMYEEEIAFLDSFIENQPHFFKRGVLLTKEKLQELEEKLSSTIYECGFDLEEDFFISVFSLIEEEYDIKELTIEEFSPYNHLGRRLKKYLHPVDRDTYQLNHKKTIKSS